MNSETELIFHHTVWGEQKRPQGVFHTQRKFIRSINHLGDGKFNLVTESYQDQADQKIKSGGDTFMIELDKQTHAGTIGLLKESV